MSKMATASSPTVLKRSSSNPQRIPSGLQVIEEGLKMASESTNILASKSEPVLGTNSESLSEPLPGDSTYGSEALRMERGSTEYHGPPLSRTDSFSSSSKHDDDEDDESFVPPEQLTIFDMIENLALPQRIEKFQRSLEKQRTRLERQRQRLKTQGLSAKDKVVEEWRRRIPTADEQLEKYKKRMRVSVDRLGERWNDSKAVTTREKFFFIAGVLNVFVSGYLIGAHPEWFPIWYSVQLLYFMPLRYYTYRKKGYHYFLADLCYFTNLLVMLSLWVFPQSKRLFIASYCLAMGNNAVAIAMWRNSLVFHSMDKVVSLFIHIMPCATLHCIVHLLPPAEQAEKFPAIYAIRNSDPSSPQHYQLPSMVVWATVPYAVWQLSYHFLITVRRREQIAAGRPTSFTWLRKSYAPTLLGKAVLSLPDSLQEFAFMLIQYSYAVLTMVPCPLWFWYRWASAGFLTVVFIWSIYNGATYYIDVFGKRFQTELDALKRDVGKWQASPELEHGALKTPGEEKTSQQGVGDEQTSPQKLSLGAAAGINPPQNDKIESIDAIPLLDEVRATGGAAKEQSNGELRERK